MADYISREAFIKSVLQETSSESIEELIDYVETRNLHLDWAGGMLKAIRLAAELPAADVRPVVHASWRDDADKIDKRFNKHDYFCPVCNTRADAFVAGTEDWYCYFAPNFCPNCGADMRKVVEIDQVKEGEQ